MLIKKTFLIYKINKKLLHVANFFLFFGNFSPSDIFSKPEIDTICSEFSSPTMKKK